MDIELRRTSKHSLHAALHAVSQRTCDNPLKACLSQGTRSPPALPRDETPVTVPALQCLLKIPSISAFAEDTDQTWPMQGTESPGEGWDV